MNSFKYFRREAKVTQSNAAIFLGVSQQAVARWEAGKTFPRPDKLKSIAALFKCSVEDLLQNREITEDNKGGAS